MRSLLILFVALFSCSFAALHKGKFHSDTWTFDHAEEVNGDARVRFVVALKLNDVDHMRQTFLDVSNPKSASYGRHLTQQQINERYGPSREDKQKVIDHFAKIPGAVVESSEHGDMLQVTASVSQIETAMETGLSWVKHSRKLSEKKSLRTHTDLYIPEDIEHLISFISLNSPVNHVLPRGAKAKKLREKIQKAEGTYQTASDSVSVSAGNNEALIQFTPYCSQGVVNVQNPPCSTVADEIPTFTFSATYHANNVSDAYQLDTDPTVYSVNYQKVYCYNTFTSLSCSGIDGNNCTCLAKLTNLPKYTQIRVNITSTSVSLPNYWVGTSPLFALTDVATAHFLSDLYNIPKGLTVKHGSNQSVVEFYKEFYSNYDLAQFLSLSGLPLAELNPDNVFGDCPNDQSDPGGEAQLDVEYIMALAPGAETFFYSFDDYNPNDPVNNTYNEGFLSYLVYVQNQSYPPLVHSLSYGDVEADIFNVSHNGTIQYGTRCDEEFMKMGLRGLTVIFSSGDDGIGNSIIRDDQDTACFQAWPAWPASSPYVTSVGATQMTDKYLPGCGKTYSVNAYPGLPQDSQLQVQCSGVAETVCSGSFGGVITSGGGFSQYANRSTTAPWQDAAVNAYLASTNAANYPPESYFNAYGRGYPDVATYGSNYMIFLNNSLTRESGTSASAPVFAAMVTLWNDMRLAYGMSSMGFIAPFLYEAYANSPEAFNDIVTGNNACGVGHTNLENTPCCTYYFGATPGWDASTGLGSPNFGVLANLVLNNQTYFPAVSAYPTGGVATTTYTNVTYTTTNDTYINYYEDDDNYAVKSSAISGLVIAVIALVLALVGVTGWCLMRRKMASEPLLNSALPPLVNVSLEYHRVQQDANESL